MVVPQKGSQEVEKDTDNGRDNSNKGNSTIDDLSLGKEAKTKETKQWSVGVAR